MSQGLAITGAWRRVADDLASSWVSDYSLKLRAQYIPAGKTITHTTTGTLGCPIGTAIYKICYFPKASGTDPTHYLPVGKQTTNPQGATIDLTRHQRSEARILVLGSDGKWTGTTKVWDAEQKDASPNTSGEYVERQLSAATGAPEKFTSVVPNARTCQKCHATGAAGSAPNLPIRPTVRNLNKHDDYGNGLMVSQLSHLNELQLFWRASQGGPARPAMWTGATRRSGGPDRLLSAAGSRLTVSCRRLPRPGRPTTLRRPKP